MHPGKWFARSLAGLVFVAAIPLSGCSFSVTTAHITGLKVGSDKALSQETTAFTPTDTVYAQAAVANNVGKVTLSWHVIAENVHGQQPNTAIPQLDKSFDLDGDQTTSITLTPPTAGWPTGTYKIEVDLLDAGKQKEQQTAEFTVN